MRTPDPVSYHSIYAERATHVLRALDGLSCFRTAPGTFSDDVGCLAAIGTLCALAYLLLGMA